MSCAAWPQEYPAQVCRRVQRLAVRFQAPQPARTRLWRAVSREKTARGSPVMDCFEWNFNSLLTGRRSDTALERRELHAHAMKLRIQVPGGPRCRAAPLSGRESGCAGVAARRCDPSKQLLHWLAAQFLGMDESHRTSMPRPARLHNRPGGRPARDRKQEDFASQISRDNPSTRTT